MAFFFFHIDIYIKYIVGKASKERIKSFQGLSILED